MRQLTRLFAAACALTLGLACDRNPGAPAQHSDESVLTGAEAEQYLSMTARAWEVEGNLSLTNLLRARDSAFMRVRDSLGSVLAIARRSPRPGMNRSFGSGEMVTIAPGGPFDPLLLAFSVDPAANGSKGTFVAKGTLIGTSASGSMSYHTVPPYAGGTVNNQTRSYSYGGSQFAYCLTEYAKGSATGLSCNPSESMTATSTARLYYVCGVTLFASGNGKARISTSALTGPLSAVPNWGAYVAIATDLIGWDGQQEESPEKSANNGTCSPPTARVKPFNAEMTSGGVLKLYVEDGITERDVTLENNSSRGTAEIDSTVWVVDGGTPETVSGTNSLRKRLSLGSHSASITVWDQAHKSSSASTSFSIGTLTEESCGGVARISRPGLNLSGTCETTGSGGGGQPPQYNCHWERDYRAYYDEEGHLVYFEWTSEWREVCGWAQRAVPTMSASSASTNNEGAGLKVTVIAKGTLPRLVPTMVTRVSETGQVIIAVDTTKATAADLEQVIHAAWGLAERGGNGRREMTGAIVGKPAEWTHEKAKPGSFSHGLMQRVRKATKGSTFYFGAGRVLDVVIPRNMY